MFERIKQLNPRHREPKFAVWQRDLRLIRQRDGRTHREIAELFAFANAHDFWRANILSPAKLREQWDRLVIERTQRKGGPVAGSQAPPDRVCAWLDVATQARCPCAGRTSVGNHANSPWYCDEHLELVEAGRLENVGGGGSHVIAKAATHRRAASVVAQSSAP